MVAAEPGADDLLVGKAGEYVEVLLSRKRLAVLGEELHEDLAEDRLVVGERPVEVEHDCAGHDRTIERCFEPRPGGSTADRGSDPGARRGRHPRGLEPV